MPYSRPTLSAIKAQVAADIQSALPGSDPLLRFSNLNITGVALANLINSQYGYLDWIAMQSVPFTAIDEYLYGWGALKGVTPLAARQATSGQITFSGTNGTVLPDKTSLTRGDGATYTTQGAATVSGGTVTVNAYADVAGSGGNAVSGTVMTLGSGIAGIQYSGLVTTDFTNGLDPETDAAFRTRMLKAYQNPPQGGSSSDYEQWALAIPGVTRAWCVNAGMGIGTVVVYVMFDVTESDHAGFPQGSDGVSANDPRGVAATGDQLTVANAMYANQPVTPLVYVCSPIPNSVNFTISGLVAASGAIKAQIASLFSSVFTGNQALGGTVNLLDFETALSTVIGAASGVITSPIGNITSSAGQVPTLGTITYV